MKIVTIVGNVILSLFTCLILVVDPFPTQPIYILYSVLLVLVPLVSAWLIFRELAVTNLPTRAVAILCNVALLGLTLWAFVKQYPHPQEQGFLIYAVLVFLVPILSLVVLSGVCNRWVALQVKRQ